MKTNTYNTIEFPNGRQETTIMLGQPRTITAFGTDWVIDRIIWVSNGNRDDHYWATNNRKYFAASNAEYNAERAFATPAGTIH